MSIISTIYKTTDYTVYDLTEKKTRRGRVVNQAGLHLLHNANVTPANRRPFASVDEAIAAADKAQADLEGHRTARKTEQEVAEAPESKAQAATPAPAADLATVRQVDYIMALLAQTGGEGSWYEGPTTFDGICAMTKAEASVYINALKGE